MSLHFPLMVNGRSIGNFEAIRDLPSTASKRKKPVQAYTVTITKFLEPLSTNVITWTGSVTHDTRNGAWVLVAMALDTMNQELQEEQQT